MLGIRCSVNRQMFLCLNVEHLLKLTSQSQKLLQKVALSNDLCHFIILCAGVLTESGSKGSDDKMSGSDLHGFHFLILDSTISRKVSNRSWSLEMPLATVPGRILCIDMLSFPVFPISLC